ncbi:hypothetical protein NHQ30_007083 [Ciborinia camelliae]|nr:hypothetical protein NHQ30_007083 [Ciborinia camelliae]
MAKSEANVTPTGGADGIVESHTNIKTSVSRRNHSKSDPGESGSSVAFDLDGAGSGSLGNQQTTVVINVERGDGRSEESTDTLVAFPQVSEGSRVGIAKSGERKGILRNIGAERRRASAPAREGIAREGTIHDGRKRRERVPTPMAMVGGLIGPGLGGLSVGIPVMPEMEREREREVGLGLGPPVSLNTQGRLGGENAGAGENCIWAGG